MPVETRYFRSDSWAVNGLSARRLQTTNSTASNYFYAHADGDYAVNTSFTVIVRQQNGTEAVIGSNVAQMVRTEDGAGYQTASWSCPQTQLPAGSALRVNVTVAVGSYSVYNSWITEQLNYTRIDATTWNFICYTTRSYDGKTTYGHFYFGSSSSNSRIENISFSTSTAFTATGSISSLGEASRFVKASISPEGGAVLLSQATALLRAFSQATGSAELTAEAYALIKALGRATGGIVLTGTALRSVKGLFSPSGTAYSLGEALASVKVRRSAQGAVSSLAEAFARTVLPRISAQGSILSSAIAVLRAIGRRTAFGSIYLRGASTATVRVPFASPTFSSCFEVAPVFASKITLFQSGGDDEVFYAGEDLLVSYRAKNRITGLYETSLSVFLTSVKSDAGEEFITEPIALIYNAKTKRYEAVFRIPDSFKGKLTFTVKAYGDTVDVEKKSIIVR